MVNENGHHGLVKKVLADLLDIHEHPGLSRNDGKKPHTLTIIPQAIHFLIGYMYYLVLYNTLHIIYALTTTTSDKLSCIYSYSC